MPKPAPVPAPLPKPVPKPAPVPAPKPAPAPMPEPAPKPAPKAQHGHKHGAVIAIVQEKPAVREVPFVAEVDISAKAQIKASACELKDSQAAKKTRPPKAKQVADDCACTPAMACVGRQKWRELYEPEQGFSRGTMFGELDLPFTGEGDCKRG
jgi:outer membrane biosynthesis protein TonB